MSLHLLLKNTVPPGGFRYKEPSTGVLIQAPSFDDLVKEVKKHRRANNVGIPTWIAEEIEDQLCGSMPPGVCDRQIVNGSKPDGISFEQLKQGTNTLVDWFSEGRKRVDLNEANRRAKICGSCNFNQVPESGCSSCAKSAIQGLVEKIVNGQRVQGEEHLHGCVVCGCSIKAKIHLPLDVIQRNTTDATNSRLPEWCWSRKN